MLPILFTGFVTIRVSVKTYETVKHMKENSPVKTDSVTLSDMMIR